ncbi:hypothetical protein [Nannocystis sp.]|uniref:hypothetical protein n=1 Tax=Nannocystis sp. TaxID=1962667 RepID=UPI0025F486CA|nr:hypothetical protein [Nannocystis sp.]MBK7829559.1 hypothetical protein [Nannocystis sp.]
MSDQQVPGFYAVGDEDTFLVSMDGQVFEVVRGGMAGPILTRVDSLPLGVPHELMDGRIFLPSVLLQAARVLDAPSSLRDLTDDALDVLDEVLWGGLVGVEVAHVDGSGARRCWSSRKTAPCSHPAASTFSASSTRRSAGTPSPRRRVTGWPHDHLVRGAAPGRARDHHRRARRPHHPQPRGDVGPGRRGPWLATSSP